MAKLDPLTIITSGFNSTTQLNNNFAKIAAAFENTLSRDGSTPNFMDDVLDMNSNRIINLADPINPGDAVSLNYLTLNYLEPNRFETVAGDSGSTTADDPNDTLTISGSGGITTAVAGDIVTIDGSAVANQFIWQTIQDDGALTISATTIADTLTVAGTGGIITSVAGSTLTIDGSSIVGTQNLWETIQDDGALTITAATATDTLTVAGTGGIVTSVAGTTLTIDGSGIVGAPDQNLWESFTADDLNTATATGPTDTLTISGGAGISTAIAGSTLTINNVAIPVGATQFNVDHLTPGAGYTIGGTTLTITTTPFSTDSVIVFFKGVAQFVPNVIAVGVNSVTLANPIPVGVTEIQVYVLADPIYGEFSAPANTAIVSGGAIGPLAHGMAGAPTNYELFLVCLAAEAGYAISDEVPISMGIDANNRGVQLVSDGTNINGRFGSDANAFALGDATTGTYTSLTNANWELKIRAIR